MKRLIFWQWYFVAKPSLCYIGGRLADRILGDIDFDIDTYISNTMQTTPPPQWP